MELLIEAFLSIFEFWIPVGATPAGREVEHGPQRLRIGNVARVLPRVGGAIHFAAAPEMTHVFALPSPDIELRPFLAIGVKPAIIGRELVTNALIEIEKAPAALDRKSEWALNGGAADHRHCDTLRQIARRRVKRIEMRCAHRARPLALRAVHPEIADQRVMIAKQIGKAMLLIVLVAELVVRRHFATRR